MKKRRGGPVPIIDVYNPPTLWEVDQTTIPSPNARVRPPKKTGSSNKNYTTKISSNEEAVDKEKKKKLVLSGARHGAIGC